MVQLLTITSRHLSWLSQLTTSVRRQMIQNLLRFPSAQYPSYSNNYTNTTLTCCQKVGLHSNDCIGQHPSCKAHFGMSHPYCIHVHNQTTCSWIEEEHGEYQIVRDVEVVRTLTSQQCGPVRSSVQASYVGWVCYWFSPCSESFFSGFSGFTLPSKTNIPNPNSIWNTRLNWLLMSVAVL